MLTRHRSTWTPGPVGWPSGLRRQFKALVSSEAWVRIPLQSRGFFVLCLFLPLFVVMVFAPERDIVWVSLTRVIDVPNSLVGQDMWFSPTRPGFESRLGNPFFTLLLFFCAPRPFVPLLFVNKNLKNTTHVPDSLGGQDTRLSPVRPGFNSRSGNFFNWFAFVA